MSHADDKATIDFVRWGGLGATQAASTAQDQGLADEPGQASFDLTAEIDALPAQSEVGVDDSSVEAEVDVAVAVAPLEAESS